jgi:hypothetical protein
MLQKQKKTFRVNLMKKIHTSLFKKNNSKLFIFQIFQIKKKLFISG